MSVPKELGELSSEYEAAKEAYDDAERATSIARSHECDCLNRLNAAQKAWDAYVAELRKAAPHDSDWKRWQTFAQNEAL